MTYNSDSCIYDSHFSVDSQDSNPLSDNIFKKISTEDSLPAVADLEELIGITMYLTEGDQNAKDAGRKKMQSMLAELSAEELGRLYARLNPNQNEDPFAESFVGDADTDEERNLIHQTKITITQAVQIATTAHLFKQADVDQVMQQAIYLIKDDKSTEDTGRRIIVSALDELSESQLAQLNTKLSAEKLMEGRDLSTPIVMQAVTIVSSAISFKNKPYSERVKEVIRDKAKDKLARLYNEQAALESRWSKLFNFFNPGRVTQLAELERKIKNLEYVRGHVGENKPIHQGYLGPVFTQELFDITVDALGKKDGERFSAEFRQNTVPDPIVGQSLEM